MKIIEHIRNLNKSIYVGERFEKNLKAQMFFGILAVIFGTIMSFLNIIQKKGFVTVTTILFAVAGVLIIIFTKVIKKREPAVIISVLLCMMFFSYYAIFGVNEGFAILWTITMPLVICYFMSVKYGILLSMYFEILVIIMFYTPLRNHFGQYYSVTFMNRFPVLYMCSVLIITISMVQYHESVLNELDYIDRLNKEVEKQTKVATERADKLGRLSEEMVETLARTIDAKDNYTNGHSFRVSEYSVALAKKLGWDDERISVLKREALMHDIGKIGVPDDILNKPGRLTDEEYKSVKSHTTTGKKILEGLEDMTEAAEVAMYHHEKYDGSGYPSGISGEGIPANARIVAVADAYDAMSSDRIYRKALKTEDIISEMERQRGKQFDPEFLDAFLELVKNSEI